MNLSEPIRTLLRDHDCVIIPDFGGLIAEYAPAQIHPVRHTLAPPTKRVAFNQALTRNDGLLVDAISRATSLTTAQAREQVHAAVQRMEEELASNRRVELVGIGYLRRAVGRGIEFEYTGNQNLLPASYGLPELVSRPVRATDALLARERQAAAPLLAAGRSRRQTKLLKAAAAVIVVALAVGANYLFALRQGYLPENFTSGAGQEQAAPARLAPMATKKIIARQQAALANDDWNNAAPAASVTAEPVVETPAPAEVEKAPAVVALAAKVEKPVAVVPPKQSVPKAAAKAKKPAPGWEKAEVSTVKEDASSTIKAATGRYYIIAGSYRSLAGAEKGRQALVRLGKPARVILPKPGGRQYKLSVADFADRTSADRQAEILRKRLGSIWILKY
ncbi:SPOR domain-containing protein [Hymenobacter sp. GOD-10R]|uniref:HU domain-containing protein n=1 Tax=Hymenobacter sp. GOD-10R TaxID=3093922 RepID=UPI002D79D9A5|nr:SPOR domain-containing protein [Hymenobacter sp. GOD-10R]WRQ26191.1 SPOR domain-containing protein [Hymenobacter sp. GOD-10R]